MRPDYAEILPLDSRFPDVHSRLIDGRVSPASVPLGQGFAPDLDDHDGGDSPSLLYDLDSCDVACHVHAQRASSAVVASHEFLSLFDDLSTTPTGRARLLDGSVSRGPFSFWRRVPVDTPPEGTTVPLFTFSEPHAFPVALAIDLLLLPPVSGEGDITVCSTCAPLLPPADRVIDRLDRHFVDCGHGVRLSSTCHDRAVQSLVPILDAAFGADRVLAERGGHRGRAAIDQFMLGAGAGLRHRPDIVLVGFDGPGTFLLLDLKTLDTAGATHIAASHTDRRRLPAHISVERHSTLTQYGVLPPRMRLVIISVSTFGSIGRAGVAFLAEVSRRVGGSLPGALLDQASWAAPQLAPFARMALGFAVRRGLAESVYRYWTRVRDPADVIPALRPPTPAAASGPVRFVPIAGGPASSVAPVPVAMLPPAAALTSLLPPPAPPAGVAAASAAAAAAAAAQPPHAPPPAPLAGGQSGHAAGVPGLLAQHFFDSLGRPPPAPAPAP